MAKRTAVLLVTVCRRYHELVRNLARTRELAERELGYTPEVVLVWARPEVCRLWLMRELTESGQVQHIIGRPALPNEAEGGPTTYPESHSLRKGLEFIRERYPESHYVVMQSADIRIQEGTLAFIDGHLAEGHEAVLFHWPNGCAHSDIWHTNFFAVSLDSRYWPPVSTPDNQDVLERQWGTLLVATQPPGVFRWHNYNDRRFVHSHESEHAIPFPAHAEVAAQALPLQLAGWKPWHERLLDWLKNILRGVWS